MDDRAREAPRDASDRLLADVLPHDVPAERERQAGLVLPESAEVGEEPEALVLPGELPLVNEDARVHLAARDGLADPIERDEDSFAFGDVETERESRRRQRSGQRDTAAAEIGERARRARVVPRDEARAVAVADRRAVGKEEIAIV